MSQSHPFRELIEAYALGALDPEERATLEAHLESGCAECSRALEEARWVTSQLAYLAPEAEPSGMLRGRLLEKIRFAAAREPAARPRTIPLWMWGAVAAALLFALYNALESERLVRVIQENHRSLAQKSEELKALRQELAALARQEQILADPASLLIAMRAARKDLPALEARWHRTLGIVVTGQKLPLPPAGRTLQLWLVPKGGAKPLPSLTLRPDAEGRFALLVEEPPGSPAGTVALAITEEPDGGSPQPTSAPVWQGAVAARSR